MAKTERIRGSTLNPTHPGRTVLKAWSTFLERVTRIELAFSAWNLRIGKTPLTSELPRQGAEDANAHRMPKSESSMTHVLTNRFWSAFSGFTRLHNAHPFKVAARVRIP